MYEQIAKLIFDYSIDNRLVDEGFVRRVIDIIIYERVLDDYIASTTIITSKDDIGHNGSDYNMEDMELYIDLFQEKQKFQYKSLNLESRILIYNTRIVVVILHELDHALLRKKMSLGEQTIDVEFTKILIENFENPRLLGMSDKELSLLCDSEYEELVQEYIDSYLRMKQRSVNYRIYHDMAPFERRADNISLRDFDKILSILYGTTLSEEALERVRLINLQNFINKCRYGYVISDYGITNCPSYDYIKLMQFEEMLGKIDIYDSDMIVAYESAKSKYTLQERILYGLPLKISELKRINQYVNPFNVYRRRK